MATALDLADVQPMLAQARPTLPASGDWWWELKHDGYRLLACTKPFGLKTRNGADATTWFPELQDALEPIARSQHILDGEVCVLDNIGRSDFDRLHARARRRGFPRGADPVVYCAFDLLIHRGKDIRQEPIEVRKARLQELMAKCPGILFVQALEDGAWLYQQVLALKLEGVVGKRAGSAYVAGPSPDWIKIKRRGATPAGRFSRKEP